MGTPLADEAVATIEATVRRLWSSHGLPPASGTMGAGSGPVLRQLVGTFTPSDPPIQVAQRAIAADIDARATALAGGRVLGTLRREGWPPDQADPVVAPLLDELAVWTGGAGGRPYDSADRTGGVQTIASRLARRGILVAREGPVRLCPSCAAPRSPERMVYHEEVGDTFLVRFRLEGEADAPAVDALAWVDAPWRLLGTTALLVNPDLVYATVDYRKGEITARLLMLRSSLGRLKAWLPGADFQVVEEHPGRTYVGRRYVYPLRHEFPDGGSLTPPSGTVQAVGEVGDSGTGVVPLVPGHGGSDAQIAERLGIRGWPLLTLRGTLDLTLMHKYAGLDLETASDFVARDLTEGGSVLARLRVLRGVPYCDVCGRPVVWFPGRCWCLEPGRLPPEQIARYGQILPRDRPIAEIEVTAWPVSETRSSDEADAVILLECDRCSRLDAPDGPTGCPCGGHRRPVGRRLTPAVAGAFAGWSRNDPVPPGDPVRLYLGERRRAPTVVHQLAGMAAVEASGADVQATVLPTITDVDLVGLVHEYGADAVRAAFVRTDSSDGPGGSFAERTRQEHRRLTRLTHLASSLALATDRAPAAGGTVPASPADRELETEDRALLARWAATELRALADYEELRPSAAYHRLWRFVEVDLGRYRELIRPREALAPAAPSRRAAVRTLASVVAGIAVALAPVAPFTAETIVRRLRPEPRSLFETEPFDVDRPPPDESLAEAWDRWLAVVRALDRFRLDRSLPPGAVVPSVAIVVPDDELGDRLRGDRAVLERLAGIGRLEVGSPRTPWEGRRRQFVPVESEIQKAYPALATQIAHILRRMPPRRPAEVTSPQGFPVFVHGQPHQITPTMLTLVETLPDRVVPTRFSLGEMYAEVPAGSIATPGSPVLSPDAAWLVRRLGRRLRTLDPNVARSLAVRVVAVDPLAKELRERWASVAATLGVASLTIDAPSPAVTPAPTLTGRTRLGARWAVEVPGLEGARARRHRRAVGHPTGGSRRMPLRRPPLAAAAPEVDFSDEQVIRHEDEVRALGEQLDTLLGAPLLGPAKVKLAWDAGFNSVDELNAASFDELATLPGFGRPVAARLFAKLGRPVPPPPPRQRAAVFRSASATRSPAAMPADEGIPPEPPGPMAAAIHLPEGVPAATAPVEQGAAQIGASAPPSVPPTEPSPEPQIAPTPPPEEVTGPPIPASPPLAPRPPPPPPPPLEPAYLPESARGAPAPPPPPAPPAVGLEVGVSAALLPSIQPFLDATAAGHRGLAVVRELPERIRALVGPRPVAVYWLSNLPRDRTIRPDDLGALTSLIRQGIEKNAISAVFLEGVEYLTRIHGTDSIVAFLKELDRLAREHEARVWLHLTPGLMSTADVERMMQELGLPPLTAEADPEAGPAS